MEVLIQQKECDLKQMVGTGNTCFYRSNYCVELALVAEVIFVPCQCPQHVWKIGLISIVRSPRGFVPGRSATRARRGKLGNIGENYLTIFPSLNFPFKYSPAKYNFPFYAKIFPKTSRKTSRIFPTIK